MQYKLKILPDKKEINVNEDTDLLSAIAKAGIVINSSCAGQGTCGSCKVIIKSGKYAATPSSWISPEEEKKGYVLACQATLKGDLTVEIPQVTRMEEIQAVVEGMYTSAEDVLETKYTSSENLEQPKIAAKESIFPYFPIARKIHIKLSKPDLQDNIPDFERIKREITQHIGVEKNIRMNLPLLRALGKFLRHVDWDVTLSIVDHDNEFEIIHVEQGDTSKNAYAIALDIGTTTVAACLFNLATKEVVGTKATYNRQISFGDDVISRIIYAEGEKGLEKLTHSICETINGLLQSFETENNILRSDIIGMQVAGNTTMIHIFLGLEPYYIRREPYIPVVNFPPSVQAQDLCVKINQKGIISCVPGIASYVGGDITAGVLACGMYNTSGLSLLIDLGTNGEIALGNKEWLVAASCSAGPAFEGVGIKSGIRAIEGAIQRVEVAADGKSVKYSTIGDKKPKGICGSGLIDIPGEFLKKGIIDRSGKFVGKVNKGGFPLLRKNEDGEFEFVIVRAGDSATGSDIVITEADIENLMRSKGAVFLGIQVLLQEMSKEFKDIEKVYISGGFGTFLDIEKAIMIGLLPDLPKEKFMFIGNSAITGAKLCMISREARDKSKEIAGIMTYIELSVNPKFMNEYTSTLFLPHTNIELFPSVKKILKIK